MLGLQSSSPGRSPARCSLRAVPEGWGLSSCPLDLLRSGPGARPCSTEGKSHSHTHRFPPTQYEAGTGSCRLLHARDADTAMGE